MWSQQTPQLIKIHFAYNLSRELFHTTCWSQKAVTLVHVILSLETWMKEKSVSENGQSCEGENWHANCELALNCSAQKVPPYVNGQSKPHGEVWAQWGTDAQPLHKERSHWRQTWPLLMLSATVVECPLPELHWAEPTFYCGSQKLFLKNMVKKMWFWEL